VSAKVRIIFEKTKFIANFIENSLKIGQNVVILQ